VSAPRRAAIPLTAESIGRPARVASLAAALLRLHHERHGTQALRLVPQLPVDHEPTTSIEERTARASGAE
jgi:hypothetical protein